MNEQIAIKQKAKYLGIAAALAFVALSAARDVAGYLELLKVSANVVISAAFATTAIVAFAWSRLGGNLGASALAESTRADTAWLNVTTLVSWVATFEGLSRVLPTTLATITAGMIPIATLGLDRLLRKKAIGWIEILSAMVIVFGIILMSWRQLEGRFAENQGRALAGIGLSILGALFAAGNNVFARRLNDNGVTPAGVFSARFWLLIVVAIVWSALSSTKLPILFGDWVALVAIGAFGVAMPIMCLLYAISQLGPRVVGYLIASIPIFVLILEWVFRNQIHGGLVLEWRSLFGILAVAIGIVWGARGPKKRPT